MGPLWASAGQGPNSSSPKQCKSDGCVKIDNSVRARLPLRKSNENQSAEIWNHAYQCIDWLSARQNGQKAAEGFSALLESNLSHLTLCYSPWPLSHEFVLWSSEKKNSICLVVFCNLQLFFLCVYRIVVLWLFKLNIKTRHEIPERKPLIDTSNHIQHRLELKYFLFAHFLLNAHWALTATEQLIDLEKVGTENFKFRTDLQGQVMVGWSVTQQIIVYKGKLLKKSSNRKSKLVLSRLVAIWLSNITFHLQLIWLQTLVTINSESRQTLFPSFCTQPSI